MAAIEHFFFIYRCTQNCPTLHYRTPYCTAAIPSPTPDGQQKNYDPKIQNIVDDISQLTLIQVADLNELLKVSTENNFLCDDLSLKILTLYISTEKTSLQNFEEITS